MKCFRLSLKSHVDTQACVAPPVRDHRAARTDLDAEWKLDDQLCGNLCRCTGYRPIRDAAREVGGRCPLDDFQAEARRCPMERPALEYEAGNQRFFQPQSFERLWDIMDAHPEARLMAGATDLGLDVTKRHVAFPCLVHVGQLPGMRAFEPSGDGGLRSAGGG